MYPFPSSIALLLFAAVPISSQFLNYGPGQLPTCAQGCTTLQQAQDACKTSTQMKSCFCQSAYLTQLYGSPSAVCQQNCQPNDLQSIQTWYTGFCKNPNAQPNPGGSGSPPSAATSSSGAQAANPSASDGPEVAGEGATRSGASNGDWCVPLSTKSLFSIAFSCFG